MSHSNERTIIYGKIAGPSIVSIEGKPYLIEPVAELSQEAIPDGVTEDGFRKFRADARCATTLDGRTVRIGR